jgi:hypothetical protein
MRPRDKTLIYAVFGLICLCLILFAAIVKRVDPNGIAADVIKDIGIVVGAIAILDLLWSRFGGDPLSQQVEELKQFNTLMRDAEASGLSNVFARAVDVKTTTWLFLIQNAKRNIDLAGHTLYEVAERSELSSALLQQAQNGVKIRILINHPDNEALPLAIDPEYGNVKAMREQMVHTWNFFNNLRDQLPEAFHDNMHIARIRSGVVHVALRRFDGIIYVLHYLYSQRTPDSPVYVIHNEEKLLFRSYIHEFERLFRLAKEKSEPHLSPAHSSLNPRPD